MRKALIGLHPVLFAIALPLAVASQHTGEYRVSDLALIVAVVAALSALLLALIVGGLRFARGRGDRVQLAAPLALILVLWFFYAVPVQAAVLAASWRLSRPAVLVPVGVAITLGSIYWLLRQRGERRARLNRFFSFFAVTLIGLSLVRIASGRPEAGAPTRSALVRALAAPVPVGTRTRDGRGTPLRDIYLIVLDGRANAEVLREQFGVEETSLEDSLRRRGFVVPRRMRSNYTQTFLSLSSLLNFEYVTRLAADLGPNSTDRSVPRYLIEYNRTARFLKSRGYKYVFFPSTWFNLTEHSPLADEEFNAWPRLSLTSELRRTELRVALLNWTLLRDAMRANRADAGHHLRTFAGLRALADDPAPTFAFAHIMLPHVPYVFDDRCRPLARAIQIEDASPDQRRAYLAQARCANRLVLDLVRTALSSSSSLRPIIIVVSDHGSRFSDHEYYEHPERVTPEFVRERFGTFGAFHLPGAGDRALGEDVSLVNVMRVVLSHYFGADLQRLPDSLFVSGERPYRFYAAHSE